MGTAFFETGAAFRAWLENSHNREKELLVGFNKKGLKLGGATYQEILDEALCFGWIDGIRKNVDRHSYTIRFTPRKPGGIWSEVNRKRVAELVAQGRMDPAGLIAFARAAQVQARQYSFENPERELAPEYQNIFQANGPAYEFFCKQAPSYQRVVKFWVMRAKKEETRQRRLATLIEESGNGSRVGAFT